MVNDNSVAKGAGRGIGPTMAALDDDARTIFGVAEFSFRASVLGLILPIRHYALSGAHVSSRLCETSARLTGRGNSLNLRRRNPPGIEILGAESCGKSTPERRHECI